MTTKEKMLDIAILLGTAIAILTALFAGFSKECEKMQNEAFRLHILANSDSYEDQKIKYALRDYIISDLGKIFEKSADKNSAKALAERNIAYIEQKANDFLENRGYSYKAVCSVENTAFPTRKYGDYTLPAGNYDALRIVIGNGEGKNWWCVLYPSVCLNAVSVNKSFLPQRTLYERNKTAARMTAESLAAERGDGIEFKFALYEWLKSAFGF